MTFYDRNKGGYDVRKKKACANLHRLSFFDKQRTVYSLTVGD